MISEKNANLLKKIDKVKKPHKIMTLEERYNSLQFCSRCNIEGKNYLKLKCVTNYIKFVSLYGLSLDLKSNFH